LPHQRGQAQRRDPLHPASERRVPHLTGEACSAGSACATSAAGSCPDLCPEAGSPRTQPITLNSGRMSGLWALPVAAVTEQPDAVGGKWPKEVGTMTVLVAYATRNGSTREVAAVIAGTLRTLGVNVELGEARYVRGLADHVQSQGRRSWNLVVLGAPL